jgi:transposase
MSSNDAIEARLARLEAELASAQRAGEALRRENAMLLRRIEELTKKLAQANNQDLQEQLQLELAVLNERLKNQNRDLYGSRSERRHKPEPDGKPEPQEDPEPRAPRPRRKTGRTPQAGLKRVVQEHLFDDADLACPKCGHRMVIKQKTAGYTQMTVETRTYVLQEHRAQVAGCGGCGAEDVAPYPKSWVPGSAYSADFAIQVAHDKYALNIPLARQEVELERHGATVRRHTLYGLLVHLLGFIQPSVDLIHATLLTEPVLHADETGWRLMVQKGGTLKWWVWTLASERLAFFLIQPSRSKKAAGRLLRGFDGVLVCDGYSAYAALERLADREGDLGLHGVELPNFDLAGCWSHARRGFKKAIEQSDEARLFLNDIDELFAIEREAQEQAAAGEGVLHDLRARLRSERSRPIVERLYRRSGETSRLSGTAFDKALVYLRHQRRPLERFLDDVRVPLTNNHAERLIRSPVQGRKAHQGSRSEGGTRIASAFYTVIGSCKLSGVDPVAYMRALVERGLKEPGYALLPSDFAAERAREGEPPQR